MNETIRTIKARRSIRKFEAEQIDQATLAAIVEAGLYAPSAHNQQSWHFTVIQDRALLNDLNVVTKEKAKAYPNESIQKMANNGGLDIFYGAPTAIIISGQESAMMPKEDCAAATQNILLAAQSLDVGSCWNGFLTFLFQSDEAEAYKQRLQIPQGFAPYYAVALGYKAANPTKAPKRRLNTVNYL